MEEIVRRAAIILGVETDRAGVEEIARRARGTPRVALRLLRRVRDFASAAVLNTAVGVSLGATTLIAGFAFGMLMTIIPILPGGLCGAQVRCGKRFAHRQQADHARRPVGCFFRPGNAGAHIRETSCYICHPDSLNGTDPRVKLDACRLSDACQPRAPITRTPLSQTGTFRSTHGYY